MDNKITICVYSDKRYHTNLGTFEIGKFGSLYVNVYQHAPFLEHWTECVHYKDTETVGDIIIRAIKQRRGHE